MKKFIETPIVKVSRFEAKDVITTSGATTPSGAAHTGILKRNSGETFVMPVGYHSAAEAKSRNTSAAW